MPQYLITAHDGADAEATQRRLAARPAHLARVRPFVESGQVVIGGAMLDEDGTMRASTLIVDFPTRTDVEAWVAEDPYTTGGVWQTVSIVPFRVAVASGLKA